MEGINQDLCGFNRNHCTNKRKFQDENLDLRERKHTCFLEKSSIRETCLQSEIDNLPNTKQERSNNNINNNNQININNNHSRYDDQVDKKMGKDSNGFSEDADSTMSVNWLGFAHNSINNLETKTCEEVSMNPTYDNTVYVSPTFEEQQLDCGEFGCSEYNENNGDIKEYEELEELFCSNGVVSDNFVLSSGRWNVNQDTQQGTEKLTIDKEFEQYFSMLML